MRNATRWMGLIGTMAFLGCGGFSLIGSTGPSSQTGATTGEEPVGTPIATPDGSPAGATGATATSTSDTAAPEPPPEIAGTYATQEGKAVITTNGGKASIVIGKVTADCTHAYVDFSNRWACTWKKGSETGPAELHFGTGQDDKQHLFGSWHTQGSTAMHEWAFLEPGHDFSKPAASSGSTKSGPSTSSGSSSSSSGGQLGDSCMDNSSCASADLRCATSSSGSRSCAQAVGSKCGAPSDCSKDVYKFDCKNSVCTAK